MSEAEAVSCTVEVVSLVGTDGPGATMGRTEVLVTIAGIPVTVRDVRIVRSRHGRNYIHMPSSPAPGGIGWTENVTFPPDLARAIIATVRAEAEAKGILAAAREAGAT